MSSFLFLLFLLDWVNCPQKETCLIVEITLFYCFLIPNRQKSKKNYNNSPTSLELFQWDEEKKAAIRAIAQNYVFIILNFACRNGLRNTDFNTAQIYMCTHILCVENTTIRLVLTLVQYFTEWNREQNGKNEENKNKTIAIIFATFLPSLSLKPSNSFLYQVHTKMPHTCRTTPSSCQSASVLSLVDLSAYVC